MNSRLAAAVTGALVLASGVAHAANVSPVALTTYSKEGLAGQTNVTLGNMDIVLRAAYTANDTIAVTLNGATLRSQSTPTLVCGGAPDAVFGLLSLAGQVATFRVTAVNVQDTTGLPCVLSGLQTTAASLATASTVTISLQSLTAGGVPIDTGCTGANCVANQGVIGTVRNQFAVALSTTGALDGVVDVNSPSLRKDFAPNGSTDVLGLQVWTDANVNGGGTNDAAAFTFPATPTAASIVLNGDFSFLDTDDNGTCSQGELSAVVTPSAGAAVPAANCQSITLDNGGTAERTSASPLTLTFQPSNVAANLRNVIRAQAFNAAGTVTYTAGALTGQTSVSTFGAGAWTLNGASVYVSYMPYQTGISQIINVSNRGSQTGEITVDWFSESGASGSFSAGTIGPKASRRLAGDILAGLQAGGIAAVDRVAMTITVNAPASDIEVYSAYNVNGVDRGTVVNTSNGRE